ncbi:MAG: hypothetical protein HZC43_10340 [Nitrosomonadales bacterium]|nr:hypothetical protein [Nitrosomonadales bacterium]
MSLLLDARKKIELALDQTGVHHAIEPQLSEALRLEESSASAAPSSASSAGNSGTAPPPRGDPVAAPARGTPAGHPPPASRPPEGRASDGVPFTGVRGDPVAAGKNLFAAKSAPAREGRRLGIIPIALIGGAAIAAGGGYYVWREISPPTPVTRQLPKPPPAAPIANAAPPAVPAVAAAVPVPVPAPVALAQESLPVAPAVPPAASLAAADEIAPASSLPPPAPLSAKSRDSAFPSASARGKPPRAEVHGIPPEDGLAAESASDHPAQGIRIERGPQQASTVDPNLLAAWQAYRSGDLGAAGQRYSEVLKQDAKNRDALLGMAAIAQQQARDDAAAHYYRQVLALDPRDPAAHAGMLSLLGPGNEAGAESRLKLLIEQQPQSPALHFALGNLYAEQSRWGDAQQAYFSASNLEPDNAQFAFNLAVSLDHLGKGALAAQHYRRALQLDGAAASSGIDRAQTRLRLNELMAAP